MSMLPADRLDAVAAGLPAPRPDPTAYRENLAAALASSEFCRANSDQSQRQVREEVVATLPLKLDVENVSRCNFRCVMCPVSTWPTARRARDMTVGDFRALVDSLPSLVEMKLQGLGEPILGGDAYFDMIRYARARHIWVRTSTNASLLHLRSYAERLIDAGVNEVQVSVDGSTAGSYGAIRVGGDFERVLQNCSAINRYCHDCDLLRTRMWVVLQEANAHETVALVDLAARLQFRRLTFALDLHGWGSEEFGRGNQTRRVQSSDLGACAGVLIERGRALGVEVTFWNNTLKYDAGSRESLCAWPFSRAFVSSDGRIVPCCMIADPAVIDLGSAQDFVREWNGPRYQAFRRAHLSGDIPEPCRECYRAPSVPTGTVPESGV